MVKPTYQPLDVGCVRTIELILSVTEPKVWPGPITGGVVGTPSPNPPPLVGGGQGGGGAAGAAPSVRSWGCSPFIARPPRAARWPGSGSSGRPGTSSAAACSARRAG